MISLMNIDKGGNKMDNRIFIQYDENNVIYYTHYKPFDAIYGFHKSVSELLSIGALVNEFPDLEPKAGKDIIYKYNKDNNTVYGVYVDAGVDELDSIQTNINTLSAENQSTMVALTEVYEMILGMMDMQVQIESLQEQINTLSSQVNPDSNI